MRSASVKPEYTAVIAAPFAHLGVMVHENAVQLIDFLPLEYPLLASENAAVVQLSQALERYWRDATMQFHLPLSYQGSQHQLLVWQVMLAIPVGQTRSYGDIARQIGSSPRAVGQACGANPLPILIPCHRVVGKTSRGGFMHRQDSAALSYKGWLLQHESAT